MSDTFTKEEISIDEAIKTQIKELEELEKQVIVHCTFKNKLPFHTFIRIWPSTLLLDQDSSHKSILVHFENISGFPNWKRVEANAIMHFTLIFTGLPKSCRMFDVVEIIPEDGGFEFLNIARNDRDVYHVEL